MTPADGFWATVELLTGMGGRSQPLVDPFNDDIEDWLETMANRVKIQQERAKLKGDYNFKEDDDETIYGTLVECSNPPVRSRLESLMGSNVVRLTDRKYMLRLMARIRQDYENRQQNRIEERKKNELMRTKMMILNRYIPVQEAPVEIRRYPLFQLYLYCDGIIEAKRKKRTAKHVKLSDSLYQLLYPDEKSDKKDTEDDMEDVYMKRVLVDGVEQLVPLSPQETAAAKREQETSKDMAHGYVLTQDEYDRLHYESDAIKELRKTQTVEDMYTKAYEILGILHSYADDGRYGNTKNVVKVPYHPGDDNTNVTEDDDATNLKISNESSE